ncbi:TPA: hypothetical protein ACQ491_006389 [Pseudomonas aeruginosa]|jgi:N-methylhydantoinase B/oxoprolinase/acetone carboxylase alpha subunit|uniref:Uncharacterized protein n=2 Tax=Pseudomonas TaxID=286 RepID=A0A9Q5B1C6_PSEFR|nr:MULTISPECIES: hypothetical protein [Pseudomonadaceae]EIU2646642.1 hypothetical protein [Pseudomonas aeruginosa]EIU2686519.1 hypothetical protein [Pseudomonas aeruginosa]EKF8205523.1 hypothetical protein [Pseudomonas aeruginosa]EKI0126897.1 hypothetical protein [Pseudomonas aeruginosa]ELC9142380.1 hypothetical protein [Pseudomonas aeruginosa]
MPLIKLDSAMVTHLQARVAALAELHRDISTLIEAIDLPALLHTADRINDRLRELHPRVIREHEMMDLREQVRVMTEDCRRLLDN